MPVTSFPLVACDYCPAMVIFGDTGRTAMPVSAQPVPGGNIVLLAQPPGAPRVVVTADPHAYPGQPRYVTHFGDCPGATTARRRERRDGGVQSETLF